MSALDDFMRKYGSGAQQQTQEEAPTTLDAFMQKYGTQSTPQSGTLTIDDLIAEFRPNGNQSGSAAPSQSAGNSPLTIDDLVREFRPAAAQITPQSSGSAAHGKSLTSAQIAQSIDGLDRQFQTAVKDALARGDYTKAAALMGEYSGQQRPLSNLQRVLAEDEREQAALNPQNWNQLTDSDKTAIEQRKAAIKNERDALTRRAVELSISAGAGYSQELEDVKKQISALDAEMKGLQKPMTAGQQLSSAGTAAVTGLERAGLGVTSALDWALGEKSLPWAAANEVATMVTGVDKPLTGLNPVTRLKERGQQEVSWWQNRAQEKAEGNDAAEAVSKHAQSIAQSSPFILLNLMSLGTAGTAAATGSTAGLSYTAAANSSNAAQAVSTIASQSLRSLAANPTAQYSFLSTFGSSYEEALQDGATEAEATIYALLNGSFGTIVEMGGGLEALPAEVQSAIARGNKGLVLDYAKSIAQEIGEEELQGILERGLKSGYQNTALYSESDPNAVINPNVMLETAKDTAIDTAIMGGGQIGGQQALSRLGQSAAQTQDGTPQDRAQTMDEREGIPAAPRTSERAPGQAQALNSQNSAVENTGRIISPGNESGRVSQTAQTIAQAPSTPTARLQTIRDAVADGKFSYVPTSDESLADGARAKVEQNGWQRSLSDWQREIAAGRANEDLAAMGAVLLNNAGNSDMSGEQYIELATDYNALMHRLGRGLAAARILQNLSPEGKLYGILRSVEKLNEDAKGKYGVELPAALVTEYRQQTTDEGRNEVLSRMQAEIARQIPSSFADKLTAFRYTAMLGNFKTQIRNVAGNTAMLSQRIIKDRLAATMELIGHAVSGGKMERTKSLWAGRQLYGEAWRDFASVAEEAMGEAKYSDSRRQFDKGVQDKRTIFKNNGTWGTAQAKTGLGRSVAAKAVRKGADIGMSALEGWRKATNWALEAGDVIFSRANYADALAGWLKAHNIRSIAEADPAILERARQYAIKQAQEATFRDTNDFSAWVSSIGRGDTDNKAARIAGAVGEGVQPFRKTPANVLVRGEEYSPLGIINTAAKTAEALKGKANVQASDVFDQLAKTMTGTGIAALGYFMRAAGLARGKNDDKEQENFDKLRGRQDYSLTFPGLGSFTIDWLSPSAIPFFMGVALQDAAADGGLTPQEAWTVLGSVTDPVLEMSMLSGVNDALEYVSSYGEDTDALPMFLTNALASLLSQFIPTLLGQFEQASEENRQTVYTDTSSLFPRSLQRQIGRAAAKIPGVDYHQQDYIDAWGRKQPNKTGLANIAESFFSPGYTSSDRSTPIDGELQRLYNAGQKKVYPQYAERSTKVNGTVLTPDEYERYATVKGQESLSLVQEFIESGEYKALDDEARADIISNLYLLANDKAKREVAAMRGEGYSNSTWDKTVAAESTGASPVEALLEKKGYSTEEYRAYAQEKQAVGTEAFSAVEDRVKAAFQNHRSEYDSKGTYAAAEEIMQSDLTDSQKDALVAGNFSHTSGGFAPAYAALRSGGKTPQQAVDFFKAVDTDGNGALKQAEIYAAYEANPKAEQTLRDVWEAYEFKRIWDEYKAQEEKKKK